MAGKKQRTASLADPTLLKPVKSKSPDTVQVIIETPKRSRNKYAFDVKQKIFELKKVLPAGMGFPYDFGFVPSTKAEDGDPLDVLVLMDEPAFPGVLLHCRVIGVIEGQQGSKKKPERNDRILAVEEANHAYAHIRHVKDLGKQFLRELEEFFVNYHDLEGEKYTLLGIKGPKEARRRITQCVKLCRKSKTA